MKKGGITIAGISMEIEFSSNILFEKFFSVHNAWKSPEANSDYHIQLELDPIVRKVKGATFNESRGWVHSVSDAWDIRYNQKLKKFFVKINNSFLEEKKCLFPFLRMIYAIALNENEGFILHGSNIVLGDKAVVFSGPSGAGKTTIARNCKSSVLNDECSVIRGFGDKFICYGNQLGGDRDVISLNQEADLELVYFLDGWGENILEELAPSQSIKKLMINDIFMMYFVGTPGASDYLKREFTNLNKANKYLNFLSLKLKRNVDFSKVYSQLEIS